MFETKAPDFPIGLWLQCLDVKLVVVAAASTASSPASDAVAIEGKPTVLVAEKLGVAGLALLWEFANVDCSYDLSPEGLRAKISLYDALVVRSGTNVGRDVFEASGGRLRIIDRVGVGIGIDNGYLVVNAPIANTVTAAEDGITLMWAMGKQIEDLEHAEGVEPGTLIVNGVPVDSYLTRSPSLCLRRGVYASMAGNCGRHFVEQHSFMVNWIIKIVATVLDLLCTYCTCKWIV
ncbi:hypothetical protein ZWY2020_058768 [Hordeum vulgare]|nr:hypothetical protein ZWY2020_058768 [Hordeum vulgare]